MKINKSILGITAASTLILLTANPVYGKAPARKSSEKPSMLYLQQADEGTMMTRTGDESCYSLTLKKLSEKIIFVSEEPARITGTLSQKEFLDSWHHHEAMKKHYPNAILHAKETLKGDWLNDTVILSELKYDERTGSMHYKACPIGKGKLLAGKQLSDISLFIDPFDPWPP